MNRILVYILFLFFSLQATARMQADSLVLTRMQADSLVFRLTHHYTDNFNFRVKADSLALLKKEGNVVKDTLMVYEGDLLVVADIHVIPGVRRDTVWVKLAHDQATMGWVREDKLLPDVVPDDDISMLIDFLSSSRAVWMSFIVGLGILAFFIRRAVHHNLRLLHFDEMDSFYPSCFLILTALLSTLYAAVQNYVPEYWQEFYFHPTLNPWLLPPVMAVLVVLVWLLLIVFIAVVEEVYHHFYFVPGLVYVCELTGLAMLIYLVFSWSTLYGFGFYLLPPFLIAMLWLYFRHIRCSYVCGNCGQRMRRKGVCGHCGAKNE